MASIAFGNVVVYLTKEELVERLFPNLPTALKKGVEIVQNDGKGALEFEFQIYGETEKEELEELKKELEKIRKAPLVQDPILGKVIWEKNDELGVTATNVMRANDIKTIGDLVQYTRRQVLAFRNMGKLRIKELDGMLERYNLKFKEE